MRLLVGGTATNGRRGATTALPLASGGGRRFMRPPPAPHFTPCKPDQPQAIRPGDLGPGQRFGLVCARANTTGEGAPAMARILLGWELGNGIGYARRLAAIADRLAEIGHQPVLALPDEGALPISAQPIVRAP